MTSDPVSRARALHQAGDHRAALAIAKALLKADSGHLPALEVTALVELEHGDLSKALRLLRKVQAKDPGNGILAYNLGLAEKYAGRLATAVTWLERSIALQPRLKPAYAELASVQANLGDFEGFEATCRTILRLWPEDTAGYAMLAGTRPGALSDADLAHLRTVLDRPGIPDQRRASLLFALSDALRHRKAHDEAFRVLKAANDLMVEILSRKDEPSRAIAPRAEKPVRRPVQDAAERHRILCDFITSTFDRDFIARFSGHGAKGHRPVFIVGMPRSGSTLVEQILSSHPAIFGAGEIADLSAVIAAGWPFRGPPGGPSQRPDMPPLPVERFFAELGQEYMTRVARLAGDLRIVTNKMLGNYIYVGMIHLCLPDAVIFDVRRNPIDNCLACYERQFRTGNEFTYDLTALAGQYRRYHALMAHWDRVLPGRVVRVRYEDLVSDPRAGMQRLLDHCGLPWDEAVAEFHHNTRPVRTASLSQVRRPISQASVNKWKLHEHHLQDLVTALAGLD